MRTGNSLVWCVAALVAFACLGGQRAALADEVWQPLGAGVSGGPPGGVQVNCLGNFNGELIVGGSFTTAGSVTANYIARWNGSSWQSLGTGMNPNAGVQALTVYNGELIAGGGFNTAGGVAVNNIARWNGSSWQPLGSGIAGGVWALCVYDGDLIAAGNFTMAGGAPANRIARWNGSTWLPLEMGMNDQVYALTVYNGQLIAGGSFTTADGTPANRIARWNGTTWQALGSGVSGVSQVVRCLSVHNNELIAGGSFATAGGASSLNIARWNGSSWLSMAGGVSSVVVSLAVYNGELIAGGWFTSTMSGVPAPRIARWNGSAWLPPLGSGFNNPVFALGTFNGALVAGGYFNVAGGQLVNYIALTNANSTNLVCALWQALGSGVSVPPPPPSDVALVSASTVFGGELIAAGHFSTAGGVLARHIARWNGSTWQSVGGGVTHSGALYPYINAMTIFDNKLVVAGTFAAAGGVPANSIASWNGTTWQALGTGIDLSFAIHALTVYNGELIAGGNFVTIGGISANRIARWNGTIWQPLGNGVTATFSPQVYALTVFNGDLIVGGEFDSADGVPGTHSIARWDGVSWSAVGGDVGGSLHEVHALGEFGNELIAGGRFNMIGGVSANHIARWNGISWNALGSGMANPGGVEPTVSSLAIYNNELVAGGLFILAGGVEASAIARWNGSVWKSFGAGFSGGDSGNTSAATITQYGSDLIAGGNFSYPGASIARWHPNEWLAPNSGTYTDNDNWDLGFSPGSPTSFGTTPGSNPFIVTFSASAQSSALCITNQRPVFEMGGFPYSITNYVTVGGLQTAHLTVNNGSLNSPIIGVGSFGTLGGNGSLTGNIFNVGTIRPGSSPTLPGTLTLSGNYQQPFGLLNPIIGPSTSQFGRLNISGTATLAGTLKVELTGSPTFSVGQEFPVLTCGTRNGTFDVSLLPFIGDDLVMNVQYDNTASLDDDGDESALGGGSGVVIVIGQPSGDPDFDGPDTFVLEGEPTGVIGAVISGLPAARDLALSVEALSPTDPGNVLVLLNEGDGASFDPVVIPVGVQPSDIVAADLADSGGPDDLAVPNFGDDNVSVLFHDGGGSFTTLTVAVGNGPSSIAAGLLNADGLVDLAVTNSLDHTVTMLFNNGNRTFTAQTPIPTGNSPAAIVVANMDGVPGQDIVVANAGGNSVMLIRNLGAGAFGSPTTTPTGGPTPSSVTPADLDNDKDEDLMLGCSGGSGSVTLLINSGGGNFGSAINLPVDGNPAASPGALTNWDMDGDDDQDVVVVVNDATLGPVLRILRNDTPGNGPIALTLFNPIGAGEEPRLVAGVDVTGDLAEDLVAVNVQQLPLAGPPESTLAIRPNISGTTPNDPGDVNGDGVVNITDLLGVIAAWGPCPGTCSADVYPYPNGDAVINIQDLLFVIANWG